jgi:hypothetical protein
MEGWQNIAEAGFLACGSSLPFSFPDMLQWSVKKALPHLQWPGPPGIFTRFPFQSDL